MQDAPDSSTRQVKLNCFENRTAPPIVIEGWKQLCAFPASALEAYWLLLAPVLLHPDNPSNQELINLFCKDHDIPPENLLAAIGCCELLLRQAAAVDLPPEAFQQDLENLSNGESDALIRFFIERYPDAIQGLRQQILNACLSAHGKVMTGLEWRVDRVLHASNGKHLDTDIVLLTLNYDEGGRQGNICLQLTREAAQQLSDFCDRLADRDSG